MLYCSEMVTKKFKEEYAKLNRKQKEAVDTIEGPVMVVAGPGTGKTTILTLRIANILRMTDTPPSGILALTFTDGGAKNMREKLRGIIGDLALKVPIYTFHGFAKSVIAEFQDHFPHLGRSRQISDIEAEALLREVLKQRQFSKLRPMGDPDFYVSKILSTIRESKQEAWTPEMLKSFAVDEIDRIEKDQESISSRGKSKGELKAEALRRIEKCERTIVLADVYESFESRKRAERKIDFDDLIFELLKTMREDKLLLQMLQERFLYILLDEHQDTNDAQNLIVKTIADFFDNPNLFVVGDEKQAIYRFQGASVENFLSFQKTWGNMRVISLADNYRSHQHILDATFKMIEKNYNEKEHQNLRIKLKSGAKEKVRSLDLAIAPDIDTEEAYLVEKLSELIKKDKTATVAVMVRRNEEVAKIFSLLEECGIPASAERGANIFSHPVGMLYFSLLEFLSDPADTEALAETLALGLWHLSFEEQTKLLKLARGGNMVSLEKHIPAISNLRKALSGDDVLGFLFMAADISGFAEIAARSPLSTEVWRGIIALSEDLICSGDIENPKSLIKELLAYKKSAERRAVKIKTGQPDSQITIMTVHGSKGLEFDYVFMPYATEESWIRKHGTFFALPKEKEDEDDIRDERRLFYVGLTRARKHVSMSSHQTDSAGKEKMLLRFIDELDQNLISKVELSKTVKSHKPQNASSIKAKQNREYIDYAKNILLTNGLSVTALNHFLHCPNEFFYKSILKLPEAPSASSEKGLAMHEALSNVWKNLASSKSGVDTKVAAKIITDSVKNYFKHSFLPSSEKEGVLEELVVNAPKVALALTDHFAQSGQARTESWVEAVFKSGGVGLKLHGKLDALIEQENKILIFDYKTREAMSSNAIKKQAKDSSGDYFRQLVFYKMLLEIDNAYKNKTIEPALVFVKPDKAGRCPTVSLPIEKADTDKIKSEITRLLESVWSGKLLTETCDDKNCKYCGFRKLL